VYLGYVATDYGSECESFSSVNPHIFPRGGMTNNLMNDVREDVISDRINISTAVLDKTIINDANKRKWKTGENI
jgi:hypothetical protein